MTYCIFYLLCGTLLLCYSSWIAPEATDRLSTQLLTVFLWPIVIVGAIWMLVKYTPEEIERMAEKERKDREDG